jgi:hypothetical protein
MMCAEQRSGDSCRERAITSCYEEFGVTSAASPPNLDIYLVHLNFDLIDDIERRESFETMPTSLQLPKEDIDALINIAPELLREEPGFQDLFKDLNAEYVDR